MQIINEEGKFLGSVNIIDLLILLFLSLLIACVITYTYAPPLVKEHKEVIFQMYFSKIPYPIAEKVFVIGNEFTPSYDKQSRARIIDVLFLQQSVSSDVDILVTLNGTLEIDVDGQYLFDGFDVLVGSQVPAPINYNPKMPFQINYTTFQGYVYRVGYSSEKKVKTITFQLPKNTEVLAPNTIFYDTHYTPIGKVIDFRKSGNTNYLVIELLVTVYDNTTSYFNEVPLVPLSSLTLVTEKEIITGTVMGVA